MYIYHPNNKITHKNDGFIENLMKVPVPLNTITSVKRSGCSSMNTHLLITITMNQKSFE